MREPEFVPTVFTDDQIRKLVKFNGRRFFERRLHLLILILLDTGCRICCVKDDKGLYWEAGLARTENQRW